MLKDRKGLEVIAPVRPAGFGPRYLDVGAWNFENTKAEYTLPLCLDLFRKSSY
jgi:hypothetical protein